MDAENDHNELRRRLAEVVETLNPAEREVWGAIQRFVDGQTRAGGSRERASNIGRNLLRKTRDIQVQKRRALAREALIRERRTRTATIVQASGSIPDAAMDAFIKVQEAIESVELAIERLQDEIEEEE